MIEPKWTPEVVLQKLEYLLEKTGNQDRELNTLGRTCFRPNGLKCIFFNPRGEGYKEYERTGKIPSGNRAEGCEYAPWCACTTATIYCDDSLALTISLTQAAAALKKSLKEKEVAE